MKTPTLDREATFHRKAVPGDDGYLSPDSTFGRERVVWVPVSYLPGSPQVAERFPVEVQDALPSRGEPVNQGVVIGQRLTRLRMRWRDDVDSSQQVTLHGESDTVFRIISGPAELTSTGRKSFIEFQLERLTSDG